MDKEKDTTFETGIAKRTDSHHGDTKEYSRASFFVGTGPEKSQIDKRERFISALSSKTDKLVTAMYMVTDCMDHDEPIRQTLRRRSSELVSEVHHANSSLSGDRRTVFSKAEAVTREIISFIGISATLGFMSDMNARILLDEFGVLIAYMMRTGDTTSENNFLSSVFLSEKSTRISLPDFSEEREESRSSALSDKVSNVLPPESTRSTTVSAEEVRGTAKHTTPVKKDIPQKRHQHATVRTSSPAHEKSDRSVPVSAERATEKGGRKDAILALIRRKGEVAIKDITDIIADCSEKTIQRELVAMVETGVLKKTGEKRWSRYSIKQ